MGRCCRSCPGKELALVPRNQAAWHGKEEEVAAKIRVSYESPGELQMVTELLKPVTKSCKADKGGSGRYKRAYLDLEIPEEKVQKSAE